MAKNNSNPSRKDSWISWSTQFTHIRRYFCARSSPTRPTPSTSSVTSPDRRQGRLTRDDFKISITADKEKRTLTVSDNGIGMTAEELESNLGVIESGSLQFKEGYGRSQDLDIIGQFGVGFYSAFMVASRSRSFQSLRAGRRQHVGLQPARTAMPSRLATKKPSAPTSSWS